MRILSEKLYNEYIVTQSERGSNPTMVSDPIFNHMAILKIRRSANRRDTVITGTLFLVSIGLTIIMGLLAGLRGREVYIVTAIDIAIGAGFLMNWVRWEITKEAIELLEAISREVAETSE